MNPAEFGTTELHVQYIACVNEAAFSMHFAIEREGGDLAGDSGGFATHQTRAIDLERLRFGDQPLEVGEMVRAQVSPAFGRPRNAPGVVYAANGHTATFSVHGILANYTIRLT